MKKHKIVALLCSVVMVAAMLGPVSAYAADITTDRIAGADRYETAVEISKAGWTTANNVILASGQDRNLVDSLSVSPLATVLDAPILLANGSTLPQVTADELARLKVKDIYIPCDTSAINAELRGQLRASGYTVHNLGGRDRYETSLNIARTIVRLTAVDTVVVVSGTVLADALSVSTIAAANGWPILLTTPDALPPTIDAFIAGLRPTTTYIVGGLNRVSQDTEDALPGTTRLAGTDRYLTNQKILEHFIAQLDFSRGVYIANGNEGRQPDALVAAPFLAGAPLVLHNNTATDDAMVNFLASVLGVNNPPKLTALGGISSISATTHAEVAAALSKGAKPLELNLVGTGVYAVTAGPVTASYFLLEVTNGDFEAGRYTINDVAVTPTPVLIDGTAARYIKIEVPAGLTSAALKVTEKGVTVLSETKSVAAGVAAPATVYGEKPLAFSAFYHDVTAGVTAEQPASTSFDAAGTVASPASFITAGTRSGTVGEPATWANSDSGAKVDAISSATYGDSVHFIPTGNLDINYADATTKADGNRVTGITAVGVGVSFDLIANARLLASAGSATAQSTAVLAQLTGITWKAEASIYKAKFLFPDASWGPRVDVTATAVQPFKPVTTVSSLYGNTWTVREAQVNFNLGATDGTTFWNDYLEYLYGGYVENTVTHARQPLVFLQNIFTHRGHTNIDVSLNDTLFSRIGTLGFPGDYKIVLYAAGYEDIVVDSVHLAAYSNGNALIEQGTAFNVSPTDQTTWFENKNLHIQQVDPATLAGFNPANVSVLKGTVPLSTSLYSISVDGSEIEVSFADAFFSGDYQGSYTINLVANTADVVSKPLAFTVNRLVTRPTLDIRSGAAGAVASTEGTALVATTANLVDFSNADLARSLQTSGRSPSTIVDITAGNASVAVGTVLKRDNAADPYYLDLSTLTVGHTYRVSAVTTNFSVQTGSSPATYATTLTYYLTVS